MNSAIDAVRDATRGTEYGNRLYLVGGYVRDNIMGRPPTEDVDIVYEGDALKLARFLYDRGIARYRPVVYPRFGTAMIVVEGRTIELVSARRESYLATSRKPNVEAASLYDDVMRRDFTINTLLEGLHDGRIYDLTSRGMADLEAGIIRTPTDPEITFYDDPLRMLRAIRFAVRFGFVIAPETYEAVVRNVERLAIISRERIRDEFVKIVLIREPSHGLRMLKESGLLDQFAHELLEMVDVTQGGGHVHDVWEHTLHALDSLPHSADLVLRLAVLFHDTGKPRTKTCDSNGRCHFLGHESIGEQIARRIMNRLRFPVREISRVARLVSMHMRIGEYRRDWKESAVRRLMHDAGPDIPDLLGLAHADRLGANPNASHEDLEDLRDRIERIVLQIPIDQMRSPLDGREIMDLIHIPSGPRIKEIKTFLCDEVVEGRLSPDDKDTARELVLSRFA